MRPLYDTRVSDLGPGDLVAVECACGHAEMLTPTMLATAGVAPETRVLGLERRLRCRECDERGRVVVSVRWGPFLNFVVSGYIFLTRLLTD